MTKSSVDCLVYVEVKTKVELLLLIPERWSAAYAVLGLEVPTPPKRTSANALLRFRVSPSRETAPAMVSEAALGAAPQATGATSIVAAAPDVYARPPTRSAARGANQSAARATKARARPEMAQTAAPIPAPRTVWGLAPG